MSISEVPRRMTQSDNFRADFSWKSPERVTVRCRVTGKTFWFFADENEDTSLELSNPALLPRSKWVVVKIRVPFWVPILIRHLSFRVPKKRP